MIRIEPKKSDYQTNLWVDDNGNVVGTIVQTGPKEFSIETSSGKKPIQFGILDLDGTFYPVCEKSFETCKLPCKSFGEKNCRFNPFFELVGYYIED